MSYLLTFLAVAAFGYFVYRKVKAAKAARANPPAGGNGGGPRPGDGGNPVEP